jgi:hypothetical protein
VATAKWRQRVRDKSHFERPQHSRIEHSDDRSDPHIPELLVRASTSTFVDLLPSNTFRTAIRLEEQHRQRRIALACRLSRRPSRQRNQLERDELPRPALLLARRLFLRRRLLLPLAARCRGEGGDRGLVKLVVVGGFVADGGTAFSRTDASVLLGDDGDGDPVSRERDVVKGSVAGEADDGVEDGWRHMEAVREMGLEEVMSKGSFPKTTKDFEVSCDLRSGRGETEGTHVKRMPEFGSTVSHFPSPPGPFPNSFGPISIFSITVRSSRRPPLLDSVLLDRARISSSSASSSTRALSLPFLDGTGSGGRVAGLEAKEEERSISGRAEVEQEEEEAAVKARKEDGRAAGGW